MAKRKYRKELIERFGSVENVEAEVNAYRSKHQLTDSQMDSEDWIPIEQLKAACTNAGIPNDGANSTMVRSIGFDRALDDPWHPSLRTYYGRGKRWFHKSALTDGIAAIRARGHGD